MDTARIAQPAPLNTRELRALDLYRRRGRDIQQVAEDLYRVPSQDGERSYDVLYGEHEECPCPDHQHRGVNCVHILCVGIHHAKRRRRPHACVESWVFVGYEDEHGQERQASYRCHRCADSR